MLIMGKWGDGHRCWVVRENNTVVTDTRYGAQEWVNEIPTRNAVGSNELAKIHQFLENLNLTKTDPDRCPDPTVIEIWM